MKRRTFLPLLLAAGLVPSMTLAADPGRETVGQVKVVVYFGTDGDPSVAGERSTDADEETVKRLQGHEKLRFGHYRLLGSDTQSLYRSYENWAQPIAGSDEILCRFEAESQISDHSMRLDLELWLSRKKILKSGIPLSEGKPVLVLGPEWRGGRLIISVELAPSAKRGS
ncbi:hypothetical protein HAHE_12150 [Haloferula helveola]|uniref:Uncharacterized protein n=1 Tax=Haloferula helveola TaxID=490095 RepID=A0ABM7RC93_9BACT|nr:hypothetical protein HAHE_12150 [Haloferula helveola]